MSKISQFINRTKTGSPEDKFAVSILTTVAAAILLIPVWFWHLGQININDSSAQAQPQGAETDLSQSLAKIADPFKQLDQELDERFSQPAKILKIESEAENLVVTISIENNTFADLIFPSSQITLQKSGTAERAVFKKLTNLDGGQIVPIVVVGQTTQAKIYFSKVSNGTYLLKISGLRYDDQGQTSFDQELTAEVTDALKPRS